VRCRRGRADLTPSPSPTGSGAFGEGVVIPQTSEPSPREIQPGVGSGGVGHGVEGVAPRDSIAWLISAGEGAVGEAGDGGEVGV
jgi:hypothetical protein